MKLAASILAGAAVLTLILLRTRTHSESVEPPAVATSLAVLPNSPGALSSATASGAAATPAAAPAMPTTAAEGPPPLHVDRCIAYARLKGESTVDGVAGEMQQVVTELEAAAGPPNDSERAAVLASVRGLAEQAGSRRNQWLDESLARCDQEIAWAHDKWVSGGN